MPTPIRIRGGHRWKALEFEDDSQRAWVCNGCDAWLQPEAEPEDVADCPGAPCLFCGAIPDHHQWCERPCRNCGRQGSHTPDCPTLHALIGYDPMAGQANNG